MVFLIHVEISNRVQELTNPYFKHTHRQISLQFFILKCSNGSYFHAINIFVTRAVVRCLWSSSTTKDEQQQQHICNQGPIHTYPDIFGSATFSFRIQKFPSTRSVFKSNSPVHTHPMVSRFTLEKLGLHAVPPYWFTIR